jgi:hypothetical protein
MKYYTSTSTVVLKGIFPVNISEKKLKNLWQFIHSEHKNANTIKNKITYPS